MRHVSCIVALAIVFLVACAPAQLVTPTAIPLATPSPTIAPTATSNIPTIAVNGLQIPDPKVTNPELFDVIKPDSPIVQFANAFGVKPEDVIAGLHTELDNPTYGTPPFVVMRTSNGAALLMAIQGENGEWIWQKATPGPYWHAQGKLMGIYSDESQWAYKDTYLSLETFAEGILSLNGQVRPGPDIAERKPSRAAQYLQAAKNLNMAFYFHYVVEPGKFPIGSNKDNVDQWLNERLSEISDIILQNKPTQPVLLPFNEAWDGGVGWNQDPNPLRDEYGNNWLDEYVYQVLLVPLSKGLVPNTDFIISFNEDQIFNNPAKQKAVHDELDKARADAFNRLVSDSNTKLKLSQMGIHKPEDIHIWLGTEMHVRLDQNGNSEFPLAPTPDQINSVANFFGDLGGIIMTEVNPNGTDALKAMFLSEVTKLLGSNPNVHGVILWNLYTTPDSVNNLYSQSPTFLFNSQGGPTELFYELLK